MRDDPQVLSRRLAAYVSPIPAKDLARRIGCDIRTAENIRRGHWPVARHWMGLIAAFGRDLTECVFHPEAAAERLQKEVQELERQLAERSAQLQMVGGEVTSPPPVRQKTASPRHENRAAEVISAPRKRQRAAA
jgi:hypothetical protein